MRFYRPTWAEINLGNLAYNLEQIKKILSPQTKIMVTIKADAYGHGLVPVAKRLRASKVDYLGVASIDEGIRLREENITLPILVLGAILKNHIEPLFRYALTPTVCAEDLALALNKRASYLRRSIKVQIKVDTGMGRLGILHDEALKFIKRMRNLKFINMEGIFTHFALADMDRDFTLYQIDLFNRLIAKLKESGIHIPLVHAANSMGLIGYKNSHFNMVRPGLIVYGLYPVRNPLPKATAVATRRLISNGVYPAQNLKIKLKPVLSLKTKVIYLKPVPAGSGISYGHDYVTPKKTRIAILPIGYGDGYPRNLSNQAQVLIKGRRFKISGKICMDQIIVDVGDLKVKVGDEVVLIGCQGRNKISAEELARLSGTIPYEIVCGLGSRIPRVYMIKAEC